MGLTPPTGGSTPPEADRLPRPLDRVVRFPFRRTTRLSVCEQLRRFVRPPRGEIKKKIRVYFQ